MITYDLNRKEMVLLLSQPQLNLNSTQKLGLTWKWLWPTNPLPIRHQELIVGNISAVIDQIVTKL